MPEPIAVAVGVVLPAVSVPTELEVNDSRGFDPLIAVEKPDRGGRLPPDTIKEPKDVPAAVKMPERVAVAAIVELPAVSVPIELEANDGRGFDPLIAVEKPDGGGLLPPDRIKEPKTIPAAVGMPEPVTVAAIVMLYTSRA